MGPPALLRVEYVVPRAGAQGTVEHARDKGDHKAPVKEGARQCFADSRGAVGFTLAEACETGGRLNMVKSSIRSTLCVLFLFIPSLRYIMGEPLRLLTVHLQSA